MDLTYEYEVVYDDMRYSRTILEGRPRECIDLKESHLNVVEKFTNEGDIKHFLVKLFKQEGLGEYPDRRVYRREIKIKSICKCPRFNVTDIKEELLREVNRE